jgi:hypothetical protein
MPEIGRPAPRSRLWIVCAVIGYRVVPHTPFEQDLLHTNASPSTEHWFGTDQIGRDVFARVITGVRVVLVVAFLATVLGTVLGTALGLITGYMRGWVDETISRFVDALLALPLSDNSGGGDRRSRPSNVTVDRLHRRHLRSADRTHRGAPP